MPASPASVRPASFRPRNTLGAAALLLYAVTTAHAQSAGVIDQQYDPAPGVGVQQSGSVHPPPAGPGFYQSFRPEAATLAGVGFRIGTREGDAYRPVWPGAPVRVTYGLYATLPRPFGAPTPALASVSTTTAAPFGADGLGPWLDLFFATPVAVLPGAKYFLGITLADLTPEARGFVSLTYNSDYRDGYVPGTGGMIVLVEPAATAAGSDLMFRTYAVGGAVTTAPEPSTVVLLTAGLGGAAVGARRRRERGA